jgi:hypothetical protein
MMPGVMPLRVGALHQPEFPITVVGADLLPLVAARQDVINRPRIFHPYRSCHNGIEPKPTQAVKYYCTIVVGLDSCRADLVGVAVQLEVAERLSPIDREHKCMTMP